MSLPEIPPLNSMSTDNLNYSIALVIDNTVYQVLNTDAVSAAQFVAQPTFVQVDKELVAIGDTYNPETGEFTK